MPDIILYPMITTALASIIFIIIITVKLLMRKLSLKQLIYALVLSAAAVYWITLSVDGIHLHSLCFNAYHYLLFPLSNLFTSLDNNHYVGNLPQFIEQLRNTFVFALIWGFSLPVLFKADTYKKALIVSAFTVLPLEILFMLGCFFGVIEKYFETGAYIFLFAGTSLGWLLHKTPIFKKIQKGEE